jgi:hypothetical protein
MVSVEALSSKILVTLYQNLRGPVTEGINIIAMNHGLHTGSSVTGNRFADFTGI